MKHASNVVCKFIHDILKNVLEDHEELDLRKEILYVLQKPVKSKSFIKNLLPVILLLIIRKILSNIASKRIKPGDDRNLSYPQITYLRRRSTGI